MESRRYILTPSNELALPLFIESIGFNQDQEAIERNNGYNFYHWIQTVEGEGTIAFDNKTFPLKPGSGVLLRPNLAHRYEAVSEPWQTLYLTFGGSVASDILTSLHIQESDYYRWEQDTPFSTLLRDMLDRTERESDRFGLNASADMYRFVLTLQKFGQLHRNKAIARNLEKLRPLIEWLDARYPDPELGLGSMSAFLGVSNSGINQLFRETFGQTPYAYLLHQRLRKAKELLLNRPGLSVKLIAGEVGFRDASHFIATFRKSFGLSPEQFRKLY
jgi:AraC family transcriptional regulator of arabinose operon